MDFFQKYLDNLEFQSLLELLQTLATFEGGRRHLAGLAPLESAAELTQVHGLVTEFRRQLEAGTDFVFGGLEDVRPSLQLLRIENAVLEAAEILPLVQLVGTAVRTRGALLAAGAESPPLKDLGGRLPSLQAARAYLDDRIDPNGEIPDRASPELASVRRQLRDANDRIHQEYARFLDRAARRGLLQDNYVTVRNDRFVIPLKAEGQGALRGVVHGSSSSGLTVYLEPFEMVPLNNRFISLQDREREIIREILGQITAYLRTLREPLEAAWDLLALTDSLCTRARFARRARATAPRLVDAPYLVIEDARHPLLEEALRPQGQAVVPVSLRLEPDAPCLIISGPNTGGKTAALKTAGLLSLMAMSGIPVPARQMECCLFRRVFAAIGDQQSLADDLSTFSAHILFLRHMLDHYQHPSLLLVDEIGTGTDPEEGSALAMAFLDHFLRLRAPLVVTTHSQALKEYALTTPGVVTAAVEMHPETLEPTYRLHLGALGGSQGLFIARKLGMPEPLVQAANERLSQGHRLSDEVLRKLNALVQRREEELAAVTRLKHEQILKKIDLERQAAEKKQALVGRLRQEFEEMRRQFEREKKQLFAELKQQVQAPAALPRVERRVERLMQDVERRLEPVLETQPVPTREALVPLDPAEIQPGLRVVVGPTHAPATVLESGREGILILAGDKRMRVPPAWLQRRLEPLADETGSEGTGKPAGKGPPDPRRTEPLVTAAAGPAAAGEDEAPPREINVIGRTAEDALDELDRFLDLAFRQELRTVAVIHGMGRGILKAAIHKRLKELPFVKHFHHPPHSEGGEGKTIVELDV
jgi:DNA mismatch repair protein MutS2